MITLEDKLELFNKMVYEKIQEESEWKLKKMKEDNERRISQKREELESAAEEIYKDFIQRGELKKREIISQAHAEGRKRVLLKLNEFVDMIVEDIYEMAKDFSSSEAYGKFLYSKIKMDFEEIGENEGVVVYIREQDRNNHAELIDSAIRDSGANIQRVRFESMRPECLGGVIIREERGFFRIDSSIAAVIEGCREMAGQLVYERLGGKGEMDE